MNFRKLAVLLKQEENNMNIRILFILISLTGCIAGPGVAVGPTTATATGINISSTPTEVKVTTAPTKFAEVVAPSIVPMNLQKLQWKVMNKADLVALLAQLNKTSDLTFALFTLDNNNFKVLDNNLQEMSQYILEQQAVISFYEKIQAGMAATETTPITPAK